MSVLPHNNFIIHLDNTTQRSKQAQANLASAPQTKKKPSKEN